MPHSGLAHREMSLNLLWIECQYTTSQGSPRSNLFVTSPAAEQSVDDEPRVVGHLCTASIDCNQSIRVNPKVASERITRVKGTG